ncbi:MAG: hypothetical protein M0D57_03990 [Sphingobacteriales bacterium JAD_PAG50586_3]|nr:MAG: hypothetical protein M0D57_03990 [Sphingobacteriales bacterium JAD_PAG50586_3]
MKTKICLLAALLWVLLTTQTLAQTNLWGVRASLHGASSTLASEKFDAANGFNKTGPNFTIGLSYARIKTGQVGWVGWVSGFSYRQMDIVSKTSATNFNIKWLEIPVELSATGNIFGFLPIGIQLGAFGAIPFQYKGAVYRYQQPNYEYGNEQYERPFFILGFKGGLSTSIGIKGKFITTLFANYNFGLLPLAPPPPDGVTRPYDIPLPTIAEFGISFLFGREPIEKP